MATVLKRTVGTATNVFTTELNALDNNKGVTSSVAGGTGLFNNVSGGTAYLDGYPYCSFELLLKAPLAAWTEGRAIGLWFLRSLDGTNFEDATTTQPPNREPDCAFWPLPSVSDQRLMGIVGDRYSRKTVLEMPPGQWKLYMFNGNTGQALAATNNVLRIQSATDNQI